MKKRLIAFLCMVVMVVGVFAAVATNANATDGEITYEAGYSKKSLMPWSDGVNGTSTTLSGLTLPMSGYGDAEDRLGTTYFDDNGDGTKDRNDGIFATCTVLTEKVGSAEGKTLVFFSVDMLNGYPKLTADVRAGVVAALQEVNSSCNISADQIMVSGSHTHTGPYIDSLKGSDDAARAAYYEGVVQQMVDAAVEAYTSKGAATMSRGSVDVSDAIGYQMNYVRHYNINYEVYKEGLISSETLHNDTLIAGSNFGIYSDNTLEAGSAWFDSDIKMSTDYGTSTESVAEANDTMELLQFTVEGQDPIVLLNWRGHCDYIGDNNLSSDYVGALRYRLEKNKTKFGGKNDYRVSYIQGASGNINIRMPSAVNTPWESATIEQSYFFDSSSTTKGVNVIKYGYMLGNAALAGLENGKGTWVDCAEGAISNRQITYAADRHEYTDGEREAAKAYYAAGGTASFPYKYQHTDGKYYNLNSTSHAGAVLNWGAFPEAEMQAAKEWKEAYGLDDETNIPQILGSNTYARYAYSALSKSRTTPAELNTIMLGDGIAMVSFPGEMFDRYDAAGSATTDSATSGWGSLVSDTYGAPFVLGYSNNATGYIPNVAAYSYNSDQSKTYSPGNLIGIGAYEANSSAYAVGEGEEVIAKYKEMLAVTAEKEAYCEDCKDNVKWTALDLEWYTGNGAWVDEDGNGTANSYVIPAGHYYLVSDITTTRTWSIHNQSICLDLNGYTFVNSAYAAVTVGPAAAQGYQVDNSNVEFNIMDSTEGKLGCIKGNGRAFTVRGTMNLYDGSLRTATADGDAAVENGETVYITGGTVNQHGGTIYGGKTTGNGGTIRFWNGSFNMTDGHLFGGTAANGGTLALAGSTCSVDVSGGEIASGTVTGVGDCIWKDGAYTSKVSISGDAIIDSIYIPQYKVENLYLAGNFSGTIRNGITFGDLAMANNVQIGTALEGSAIESTVRVYGTETEGTFYLNSSGATLIASDTDPNNVTARIGDATYVSMDAAMEAYDEGEIIKLNKEITYDFNETVYLDLNGHNANVTVSNGTVYVLDSTTDDYKGSYGSVTGTGDIQPAADAEVIHGKEGWYSAYSAYIAVEEEDGARSYHRVDLGIEDTVALPGSEDLGIYYDFGLYVDETLKNKITSYGVAVSTKGDPMENDALKEGQGYAKTELTTFAAGSDGNIGKSSTITNIMKQTNGYAANKRNATSTIYGRAYMVLDGNYVFAPCAENSLKSTVQAINNKWADLTEVTQTPVLAYYNAFKSVIKAWNVKNITAAAEAAEAEEEETLKILTVGNSHSVDAMYMLYEVYQQMNPEKEIELGILYYSGCPVERHLQFIQENTPAYVYYKINKEIYESTGKWQLNDNSTFNTALKDEQWDYIILQEMSNYIAQKTMASATNGKLDWLIQYVKTNAKAVPKLGFHMVWAMPMDDAAVNTYAEATRGQLITNLDNWFGNKDGKLNETDAERLVMQRRAHQRIIDNTTKYIETNTAFDFVINTGSAVNHALNAFGVAEDLAAANHKVHRDYTHLSNWSRLMAAYVWYAELETAEGRTVESVSAEDIIATVPSGFFIADQYGITGETLTDGKFVVDNQDKMVAAINYALETPYNLLFDRVAEN